MIEHVPRHKEDILLTTLKKIVNMYTQRGMGSAALIMDSEFECLWEKNPDANLNTTEADEHAT